MVSFAENDPFDAQGKPCRVAGHETHDQDEYCDGSDRQGVARGDYPDPRCWRHGLGIFKRSHAPVLSRP